MWDWSGFGFEHLVLVEGSWESTPNHPEMAGAVL